MATGQEWRLNSTGGYLANKYLSKKLRYAALGTMKARQFTTIEEGYGKGEGDTIDFNKVNRIASSGGTVSEHDPLPESNFTIERDNLTVSGYGNKVPYTKKLETLSQFNLNDPIQKALKDDMKNVLDAAVLTELRKAAITYAPTGTASSPTNTVNNDGSKASAGRDILKYDFTQLRELMEQVYKIPYYDDENFIALASGSAIAALQEDESTGGWIDASKYAKPEQLFTGEMGMLHGFRFVKCTENTYRYLGNTGSNRGEVLVFGGNPVMEGVALPEEIRADVATDLGRSQKIGWHGILGFKITWTDGTESTEDDNVGKSRVVNVTSS